MLRTEKGKELFSTGANCAQAVVGAFCDDLGLNLSECLKMSSGFGGGMRHGEVCGVVSGAIMVIGLKCGQTALDDTDGKTKANELTIQFHKEFEAKNKTIVCRDLLGCDTSTPEGKAYASENSLTAKLCPSFVVDAIEILEKLIFSCCEDCCCEK